MPHTENQCRTVALMGSFLLLIISAIGTTFQHSLALILTLISIHDSTTFQCSMALISIDIDTDFDTDFH